MTFLQDNFGLLNKDPQYLSALSTAVEQEEQCIPVTETCNFVIQLGMLSSVSENPANHSAYEFIAHSIVRPTVAVAGATLADFPVPRPSRVWSSNSEPSAFFSGMKAAMKISDSQRLPAKASTED